MLDTVSSYSFLPILHDLTLLHRYQVAEEVALENLTFTAETRHYIFSNRRKQKNPLPKGKEISSTLRQFLIAPAGSHELVKANKERLSIKAQDLMVYSRSYGSTGKKIETSHSYAGKHDSEYLDHRSREIEERRRWLAQDISAMTGLQEFRLELIIGKFIGMLTETDLCSLMKCVITALSQNLTSLTIDNYVFTVSDIVSVQLVAPYLPSHTLQKAPPFLTPSTHSDPYRLSQDI